MKLGEAIKGYRAIQVPRIGLREAVKEIGISPTTLSRVERGTLPDAQTLNSIWGWLTRPETSLSGPELTTPPPDPNDD